MRTQSRPNPSLRVVFDEFHSESWSVCAARAREMQPEDPANASYARAAEALNRREFAVSRNPDAPLDATLLKDADVLVLLHPCDPKWEHTTRNASPVLSGEEIAAILGFVEAGGGLLVVSEYEHDKYGDNLNELLAPVGLRIANGKVFDRAHCAHENPEWILGAPASPLTLGHLAKNACFYRTGWCEVLPSGDANLSGPPRRGQIAWRASESAHPASAPLIALAEFGRGRVGLVTDSNLFGDERLESLDHLQLWLNLMYWIALPRFAAVHSAPPDANPAAPEPPGHRLSGTDAEGETPAGTAGPDHNRVLSHVTQLRALQRADGSVEPAQRAAAAQSVDALLDALERVGPGFSHQRAYFEALSGDFRRWMSEGFLKPDFSNSLAAFQPQSERIDGREHLVLFPMYTPNASSETRFEALVMRTPWPDWLARLESRAYSNPKFVPGHLLAFTEGYASECAVLFPETVSVENRGSNHFGVIFCDREARRLQRTALAASRAVHLALHPQLDCLLHSLPMLLDTLALWDLIHDASHSLGELPFDPFMIRQRAPFWMYGLEELRVDLRSFEEAARLACEDFPFAQNVCSAIVLDRILRFPITGPRVRNYDALGGQLLFAFLHQSDALEWSSNRLTLHWDRLPAAIRSLRMELGALYKSGADCSKMALWLEAHDLICRYLRPNVASRWKKESRDVTDETDLKRWISLVHHDEFPLGNFHLNLLRKLQAAPA